MENETLKKILKEKSVSFTAEELQLMIDEELEKSEEEMDTDLIDKCLDALDEIDEANAVVKKKRIKLRKALLIAAIIAVLLSIAIPVCAKYLHINASADVVKQFDDYFDVDLTEKSSADDKIDDITQSLKKAGIAEVVLPMEILNDDYEKYDFYVDDLNEFTKNISFVSSKNDLNCNVVIDSYLNNCDFSLGQIKANNMFEHVKQLDIIDVDVLVFSKNGENGISYIYYIYGDYEYNIALNCDFEEAEKIAETIAVIQ